MWIFSTPPSLKKCGFGVDPPPSVEKIHTFYFFFLKASLREKFPFPFFNKWMASKVLTLLCTGKVLVSGAFQSDLRDPKCWHNSYIVFMEKNSKFFQIFSVFWTPSTNKKIFLHFWVKKTYFYILGGQHVQLTPKKCWHLRARTRWG